MSMPRYICTWPSATLVTQFLSPSHAWKIYKIGGFRMRNEKRESERENGNIWICASGTAAPLALVESHSYHAYQLITLSSSLYAKLNSVSLSMLEFFGHPENAQTTMWVLHHHPYFIFLSISQVNKCTLLLSSMYTFSTIERVLGNPVF